MRRLVLGTIVMLAAIALQLAMVIRVIVPSLILSLVGYVTLFLGMFLVLLGVLGRRGEL